MENKKMTIYEIVASEGWKTFMKKLEMIGAVIFGAAFILSIARIHGYGILLTLGGSTLAVVYYFEVFKQFQSTSKLWSFIFFKIHGFGLACSWWFILFTMEHWPIPGTAIFFVSLCALLMSLVIGLRLKNQEEHSEIVKSYFIRILVALGLIVYVYLTYML